MNITEERTTPIWSDLETGQILSEAEALEQLAQLASEAKGGRRAFPPTERERLAELEVKYCPRCEKVKPLSDFSRRSSSADGLDNSCRVCNAARTQQQRDADPEAAREYSRQASAKHRTKPMVRLREQLQKGYQRAVALGVPADNITPEELIDYWESIGINPMESIYSGTPLTELAGSEQPRSIDHTRALSEGGGHTLDNLVPCTRAENEAKSKGHFLNIVGTN